MQKKVISQTLPPLFRQAPAAEAPLGKASKWTQEGVQCAPPGTPGGVRFTPALKSKFFYGGTREGG